MRLLGEISDDSVYASFLISEFRTWKFDSLREGIRKGLPEYLEMTLGMGYREIEDIVNEPDVSNAPHNDIRKHMLMKIRGPLISGIPVSTRWYEARIDGNDLRGLLVINSPGWNLMCENGSRVLGDVVDAIIGYRKNKRIDLSGEFRNMKEMSGNEFDKKIILIGSSESGPFTIIDGNHRAAALYYRHFIRNLGGEYPSHEVISGIHGPDRCPWE